jgi:hypothetical protein
MLPGSSDAPPPCFADANVGLGFRDNFVVKLGSPGPVEGTNSNGHRKEVEDRGKRSDVFVSR